jgi:acyl carrier protein phosphodiesterase
MNFLGHIYLSNDDLDLMHANLFGDFVKGRDLSIYAPKVQSGILLHRQIDSYIGQHEDVRQLIRLLSPSLPKVASVAVDIYFDHFLSKYWSQFHAKTLYDFLNAFYNHKINEDDYPNELFLQTLFRLKKGKWLSEYVNLDGIELSCIGVSRRISFPNALMNGRMVLENNYDLVKEVFFKYMENVVFILNSNKFC